MVQALGCRTFLLKLPGSGCQGLDSQSFQAENMSPTKNFSVIPLWEFTVLEQVCGVGFPV